VQVAQLIKIIDMHIYDICLIWIGNYFEI
jgi:hypothetical protein